MKNLITIILIGGVCLFNTPQATAGDAGLDVAAGLNSNYGLVGVGVRYLFTEHIDVHVNAGADITGFMSGIGTRLYSSPIGDKCFFFIPCKPLVYGSLFWAKTNGTTVTVTENGQESEYKESNGNFASVAVGSYDIYGGWFTTSLDLGYRYFYNEPNITHSSGPNLQSQINDIDEDSESGVFVSFSIGVLF